MEPIDNSLGEDEKLEDYEVNNSDETLEDEQPIGDIAMDDDNPSPNSSSSAQHQFCREYYEAMNFVQTMRDQPCLSPPLPPRHMRTNLAKASVPISHEPQPISDNQDVTGEELGTLIKKENLPRHSSSRNLEKKQDSYVTSGHTEMNEETTLSNLAAGTSRVARDL